MSIELSAEELLKEQKLPFPFFRPLSQRKENTWVISLFVILHLIAFAATMIINDCWSNSHGLCAFKPLGRFSFQPLSENPLLGLSASALDEMGALRQRYLAKDEEFGRVFTGPCLHAGVFHLIINLSCVVFVGIHLEQEFGPSRIGVIYMLSALTGSLVTALFLQDRPSVASSSALFGLLGAMLSGDWTYQELEILLQKAFSQTRTEVGQTGVEEYFSRHLQSCSCRSYCGISMNKYCTWCHYIDCVPFKWWSCGSKMTHCETMANSEHLTLTCSGNGKFRG